MADPTPTDQLPDNPAPGPDEPVSPAGETPTAETPALPITVNGGPGPDTAPEPDAPSPRQLQRAATRATKESLIAQAELVAMTSPPSTAPTEMKALLGQWKQAGRITRPEDDALWARFNLAQDQLYTRLDLLRSQRQAAAAEAKQRKESLIATAEDLVTRADVKQAGEMMAALMAEWKTIGQAPDDKGLWLRFRAAQDAVFARRNEARTQAQGDQRAAATTKRSLIGQVQALVGAPDLRQANADLRDLQAAFRVAGFAGRDNKALSDEFRQAGQEFYAWVRKEPVRRKASGEQPTYGRRARLVQQIADTQAEIIRAETALKATDPSGAKRSHGTSITLTLGQTGAYSSAAAEAMRLKIRLSDLETQLLSLDTRLGRESSPDSPA
jgi:hypothetical protein